MPQIARRIRGTATTPGVMAVTRREAEALARTSVIAISNKARIDQYLATPGARGIRWVSTLDNRTTPICRALDGKAWDKADEDGRAYLKELKRETIHLDAKETARWKDAVKPVVDEYLKATGEKGLPGDKMLKDLQYGIAAGPKAGQ
jgi:SPP1 gp7 family putative phage head morphogenesis protein